MDQICILGWAVNPSGQFVPYLLCTNGVESAEIKGGRGNGRLFWNSAVEESIHTWLKDGCPVSSWLSSKDSCRFQSSALSSI